MSFVHLNLHTEFSLVDSTVRLPQLMEAVVEGGMHAVALTDLNNLFGLIKFYRKARSAGVKPITGAHVRLSVPGESHRDDCILLCQNNAGFLSLKRLLSLGYLEGQQPDGAVVIELQWLLDHGDGLLVLSGGLSGEIGRLILAGNIELAKERAAFWQSQFGDRFYLELQRVGIDGEEIYTESALAIAQSLGIAVVATNPVRFIAEEAFYAHEARVCIGEGYVLDDPKRPKRYTPQQYLRSAQEMVDVFRDIPVAVSNTTAIAQRCNLELSLDENYLPRFPTEDNLSEADYLNKLSQSGLEKRLVHLYKQAGSQSSLEQFRVPYDQRLRLELEVISGMGFPGYFLIVADFIRWAKEYEVPVGPGRGSGAGSLVAYALGITDIDPLEYDLLFERFLNPERISMPDFDIDFCMDKRDRVIDYVAEKYGRDQVSQIITFGTMAAKAAVRDVGRVLGHPYGFVDRIAKLIPNELGITLSKALDDSEELKAEYDNNEEVQNLMDLALSMEGLSRNAGKHAGGVLIAPSALTDFTPLYCEPGGAGLVSQFDKDDVESAGLVKFDFLGLKTLTVIDWAIDNITSLTGEQIDIAGLPLDDVKSYQLLKSQKTTAIFQLESHGIRQLIGRLQPDTFEDVIDLVAMYRPGPLGNGMVDDYVNCRKGTAQLVVPHPKLTALLSPTNGIFLYQEQVMQAAQILAGYSLGEADVLRRAMGKKKPEEMEKQRAIFMAGSEKNGVDQKSAAIIFDQMEKFAGYGFNKSHSAAYALIAYQTAWLKANYPAPFMAAVLSADLDNTDKLVLLIDDCRQLDLTIALPDINASDYRFTVTGPETIRFGLGGIKGVGEAVIQALVEEREANGLYASLQDLCDRLITQKVNRRVLETLIKAGALDSLSGTRRACLMHLPEAIRRAEQYQRDLSVGQGDIFGSAAPAATTHLDMVQLPEFAEAERLELEKSVLGLYLTGHPLDAYTAECSRVTTTNLAELVSLNESQTPFQGKQDVCFLALISSVRYQHTDRGRRVFVTLEDKTAAGYELLLFNDLVEVHESLLQKDSIIVIEGTLSASPRQGHGVRLRVNDIFDIPRLRQERLRWVKVKVASEQMQNGFLDELQSILIQSNQPSHHVVMRYDTAYAAVEYQLDPSWQVPLEQPGLERLREWLGQDAIEMVYG